MTTTNESPLRPLIDALDAVNENAGDTFTILFSLKPFMTGPAFEELALAFDMCPIHEQDLDACADDDTDNEAARGPIPLTACRHLRPKGI